MSLLPAPGPHAEPWRAQIERAECLWIKFGPGDARTLAALVELAEGLRDGGQLEREIVVREQLVAIHEQVLGSGHEKTLCACDELQRALSRRAA